MEWIKAFLKFIKYVSVHKWLVGKELWKKKMYWEAITHDLSKFLPDEAIGYIIHNHKDFSIRPDFQARRQLTQKIHDSRNPHQSNHWNGQEMPERYIIEMLIDWKVAAKMKAGKFQTQTNWWDWYFKNKPELAPKTKKYIEEQIRKEKN